MYKGYQGGRFFFPVLMYHELYSKIEDEKYCMRTMGPSCGMNKDIFRNQLAMIKHSNVNTISFRQLSNRFDKKKISNNKSLVITFDDGHLGNYIYAYPILHEKQMKAVFFVATDLIETKKMMSWVQLREMASNGMSIQSHGMSHEPFETFSEDKLEEELYRSKNNIQDKIGQEVDTISLPHGSLHYKTLEKARKIGYRFVCTSSIDYFSYRVGGNPFLVPRIPVSGSIRMDIFNEIVLGNSQYVYKWKKRQKIKSTIRKFIGVNNYRRIYRIVHNISLVK